MKKTFILSVLMSFIIFTACDKQEVANDFVPADEVSPSLAISDSHDHSNVVYTGIASFTIDNRNGSLHEKDALLLTNNSVNAVSYKWDFGNGDESTEAQPAYEYDLHGNYTISLTITDTSGNIHKTSNEIVVLCVFGGVDHDNN